MSGVLLRLGGDRRLIGEVPAALLGDQRAPRLGVLLDETMIGTIALDPGETAATWRFSLPLPGHRLAARLDLLRLDSGESVLAKPVSLAGVYRFAWRDLTRAGARVVGAFTLAVALDPALYVAVTAAGILAARGFARRDAAGVYRFSLTLTRLLPLGPASDLAFTIAGAPVAAALAVSAADLGFAGYVEAVTAAEIRGWAADLTAPGRMPTVILREDGREIARALAEGARPDLAAAGIGDGRAGFSFPYAPRPLAPGAAAPELSVILAESGQALVGSPQAAPSLPGFAGYFDGIENAVAFGWALNLVDPGHPLVVEIVQDGRVIAAGRADLPRPDVTAAGLPGGASGFRLPLPLNQAALTQSPFRARLAGTELILEGSPRDAKPNPAIAAFLAAFADASRTPLPAPLAARFQSRRARRIAGLRLSLVMPVFNPRLAWLEDALASVRAQRADAFELIAVDDGSTDPAITACLRAAAAADPRIRVLRARTSEGFARALGRGIAAAQGSHIAFLDHDDALAPDAVFQLLCAAGESGADLVFADAAFSAETFAEIETIAFGGAFSHDAFLARAALPRPLAIARRLAGALAPPDAGLEGAEEFDFVLRAIAAAETIAHLPRVLYLARRHGLGREAVLGARAIEAARRQAVARHLAALALPARVVPGLVDEQCGLDWPAPVADVVAVIRRDAPGSDDPGRAAALAATLAALSCRVATRPPAGPGPEFLLFLDEAIAPPAGGAWLSHLCALAARPDIGAVTPLLLTPSGQVREMGLVIAADGMMLPALAGDEAFLPGDEGPRRNPGPGGRLTLVRDVAAASASALLVRRAVFARLGGFARDLGPLAGADFTRRVRAQGLRVLASGLHPLRHHGPETGAVPAAQAARFLARWPGSTAGDPFYSPLCTPRRADFAPRDDDGCRRPAAVRLSPSPAALLRTLASG